MANNEQIVGQALKDNFDNAVLDIVRIDFFELKKAALKYTKFLLELYQQLIRTQHTSNLMSKDDNLTIGVIVKRLAQEMSKSDIIVRNIFEENFNFRHALDSFLGRKIPMVLMNQDGSVLALDQAQQRELYTEYLSKNTEGRGRLKNLNDALASMKIVQSELSIALNARLANYKIVFTEAKRRAGKDEDQMNYTPSAHTIYYRLFDDYHITGWSKPVQDSEIAELYARIVLNRQVHGNIETYLEAMAKASEEGHNWTRAIQEGDVTVKTQQGKVNLSLALKYGDSFQTQGIRQYILAAFNISVINDITPQQLEGILKRISNVYSPKTIRKIVQQAGGKVEQELNNKMKSSIPIILEMF